MEYFIACLITFGLGVLLFIIFVVVVYIHSYRQTKTERFIKDGERWRELMKIYIAKNEEALKKEGFDTLNDCQKEIFDLEGKYFNVYLPMAWINDEVPKAIERGTKIKPTSTGSGGDFNVGGAIIGGMLGGITGAYIGGNTKKKDK